VLCNEPLEFVPVMTDRQWYIGLKYIFEGRSMNVRVSYLTEPNPEKSGGQIALPIDRNFASVELAKAAPFPGDSVFAFIHVEGGYYSCQKGFDWKYHEGDIFDDRSADR